MHKQYICYFKQIQTHYICMKFGNLKSRRKSWILTYNTYQFGSRYELEKNNFKIFFVSNVFPHDNVLFSIFILRVWVGDHRYIFIRKTKKTFLNTIKIIIILKIWKAVFLIDLVWIGHSNWTFFLLHLAYQGEFFASMCVSICEFIPPSVV